MDSLSHRRRAATAARDLLATNPSLPLVTVAIAVLLAMITSDAGYYPTIWYPGGLVVLGLLAVGLIVLRDRIDPGRASLAAIALLGGFAGWSYLSISWSEDKAIAWDGANRAALYTVLLALISLWRMDARGARWLLGLTGLGLGAVGLIELSSAMSAENPSAWFIDIRFSEPAGYINANVALWTLGLFPCLLLAGAREAHPVIRGLCMGSAGLLGALALLGQSRGWVVTLPIAVLAYVAVSPRRVRALAPLIAAGAGVLLVAGPILDVRDGAGELGSKLSHAGGDILVMASILAVAWVFVALVDRASIARPGSVAGARTAIGTAMVAVVSIAAVLAIAEVGSPTTKVAEAWQEFKDGGSQDGEDPEASRFSTGGTNRYDFWVVAIDLFRERPWLGIGAANFQADYLRRGSSGERPRFPHSLGLGVLSQTGLMGAALLIAALASAAVAAAGAIRSREVPAAMSAAAASVAALYWLLHANVDWFWEFAGLTGIAVALLGIAGALRPPSALSSRRDGRPRRGRAIALAGIAGLGVVAVSFAAPWLSAVETDRAAKNWPSGLGPAYERLDRARALNPLSPEPDLVAATIALRADDLDEAGRRFRAALQRQPRIAYALMELGAIRAVQGQRGQGLRLLRQAVHENPRSPIMRDTLRAVDEGRSVSIGELNERILDDARSRVE